MIIPEAAIHLPELIGAEESLEDKKNLEVIVTQALLKFQRFHALRKVSSAEYDIRSSLRSVPLCLHMDNEYLRN